MQVGHTPDLATPFADSGWLGALSWSRSLPAGTDAASYATLREQLRGQPEEGVIENAASELLGLPFDEEGADSEFRDTLEKLQAGGEKRAFDELQLKAQQFGVAGLSAAEKQAYIQFLATRSKRS